MSAVVHHGSPPVPVSKVASEVPCGITEVGDASVYGTLRRLYAAGALSSYVVPSDGGPHRKYYSMNPSGYQMVTDQREIWNSFASTFSALINDNQAAASNGPARPGENASLSDKKSGGKS